MAKQFKDPKWKEVSPGLWERKNTPKSVPITPETIEVYQKAAEDQARPLRE